MDTYIPTQCTSPTITVSAMTTVPTTTAARRSMTTSSGCASRLSRPAIETLAIIAYKQPITRAKLEAIRGVGCGEVLKSLLERRLIAVTGRAEELGRPMLYGTTRQFLDAFGIRSVKDLPSVESMVNAHAGDA